MTSQLFNKAAPSDAIDGPYESFLTPLVKAERGGLGPICDVIKCYHEGCGHIETKTSCHNYTSNLRTRPNPRTKPRWISCNDQACDQSVITTICIPGKCVHCVTQGDATNPILISFNNDPTITRSDPETDTLPPSEIEKRQTDYHKLAADTRARHRALTLRNDPYNLLYSDFGTDRFDQTAREFIEHFRQLQRCPGVVDRKKLYADLRKRREEEDRQHIDIEDRQYFSGGKFDETDLMSRVDPNDGCLDGQHCIVCGDDFMPEPKDPRGMPCGHMFHWTCI